MGDKTTKTSQNTSNLERRAGDREGEENSGELTLSALGLVKVRAWTAWMAQSGELIGSQMSRPYDLRTEQPVRPVVGVRCPSQGRQLGPELLPVEQASALPVALCLAAFVTEGQLTLLQGGLHGAGLACVVSGWCL